MEDGYRDRLRGGVHAGDVHGDAGHRDRAAVVPEHEGSASHVQREGRAGQGNHVAGRIRRRGQAWRGHHGEWDRNPRVLLSEIIAVPFDVGGGDFSSPRADLDRTVFESPVVAG